VYIIYLISCKIKEGLLAYDPKVDDIKRRLALVHKKASELKYFTDKKSYTINKHKMHLCVKDQGGDYYDDNMLVYVGLHELAHVLCDEIGHTPKYWAIFDKLLEKAAKTYDPVTNKKVYDPNGIIDKDYCDSNWHNS
jgi:hypothetical protein